MSIVTLVSSSRFLFGRDNEDMTLAEATFLASSFHLASSFRFSCCILNWNCLSHSPKKAMLILNPQWDIEQFSKKIRQDNHQRIRRKQGQRHGLWGAPPTENGRYIRQLQLGNSRYEKCNLVRKVSYMNKKLIFEISMRILLFVNVLIRWVSNVHWRTISYELQELDD